MDPRRLYSAIVFIPLLYAGIRYSPPWLLSLLLGTASLFALWEFLTLYFGPAASLGTKMISCLGAVILLVAMYTGYSQALNLWLLGFVMVVLTGFFISPTAMRQRLPVWAA
jgi:CDP-diglyceride synthetase